MVLAELLELAPGGVEEVELGGEVVEYAVYGAPGELPALPALTAAAGEALVEIETREVADDWEERWRQFHRPLVIGTRLTVRPPWEPPSATDIDLVIDPGQAFGTGAHATTRLCVELMLDLPDATGPFVDLGCGSGVLAIAAARLGYAPVIALDNDPAAIAATRANARRNRVRLDEVRRFDLRAERAPLDGATVAANLLRPLLAVVADGIGPGGEPRRLIASGLLLAEQAEISAAFAAHGLNESDRLERGDWAALLLSRQVP
ncbi:MAG TPA: 50S ribosomal protein L11 methyltransferase [Candidatus Limnocylindria bacterium]|nr:50S ribosomal protein L11 methyltransferase [Candidatus Limnocylindria bacterium]